jgi:hypothetical protein
VAVYIVEHREEAGWVPVLVCRLKPEDFSRFLGWVNQAAESEFHVLFANLRVKRTKLQINAGWIFDGKQAKRFN